MHDKIGFDNEKYIREQTAKILERVERFDNKLYLEFGGKLLYDYHAARVLPGYDPNVKMRLIQELKDKADILLCIYAGDIERKKIRADFGITYDSDALKLIDDLRNWGIECPGRRDHAFRSSAGGATLQEQAGKEKYQGFHASLHQRVSDGCRSDRER